MLDGYGRRTLDTITVNGMDNNHTAPAAVSNDNEKAVSQYTIPPVLWMMFFLVVGYVGLRYVLEEA